MELHDLSALEQARAIAHGEVTAVALTEHYLARAERHNATVGAFARITPDLALHMARAADDVVRASGGGDLPALHGVVCPVKDLESIAGVPTGFGTSLAFPTPEFDDNVVVAMRSAGLVFTGKTSAPEFGLPCYTEPAGAPPARTPWDLTCSASGSSGGAAAAVAAGLAPIAQGSDGGGSIRLPASVCGLVGIKPTRGRVSNGPASDGVGDLVSIGPLARSVRDAAALLDVMSVPFEGDPFRAQPQSETFLAAADLPLGSLRVGMFTEPMVGTTPPTADVVAAVAATATLLVDLGHRVEEIPPLLTPADVPHFEVIWAAGVAGLALPPQASHVLRPLTAWLAERGRELSAGDLAAAVLAMRRAARRALVASAEYDVILAPTAAAGPFPVGFLRNDDDPAADFAAQKQWASYTAACNVTGQPAINVPLYWTAQEVPIGVQLIGRPNAESTLIALAAQLEEAQPWQHHRPTLW